MAISSSCLYKRRPSSQHSSQSSARQIKTRCCCQMKQWCWMRHMMSDYSKASLLSTRDNTRDWCPSKMVKVIASTYLNLRKMPCQHLLGFISRNSAYEFSFVMWKPNGKLTLRTSMESRLVMKKQVTVSPAF